MRPTSVAGGVEATAGGPPSGLLAGRRGIVLGVSGINSIGYHIARTLRELGATVAVTCRPARLAHVAPLIAELGGAAYPVELADESSLAAVFDALGQGEAPLDFLVHGLVDIPDGVLARSVLDVARADFEHVMSVAAWSLIAACRYAHPLLARSTAPRVVALTSAGSHRMTPHYHVAGIAKAALESAVLYLAMQLGKDGILINAIGASLLPTDGALRTIGERNAQATRAVQARRSATGRAIEYSDVARCAGFLCSPLACNVTGEVLTIDGGFSRTYL
ncbi:MAG TPA: SDR family oxidoreductase [Kofleriaceae bacterium]|jgi:enoyl-[acyl-carrier protein] reductase I|nr:SDR family oxidoreductase [Kofleriaceae bacterium]